MLLGLSKMVRHCSDGLLQQTAGLGFRGSHCVPLSDITGSGSLKE
uniref:Uncharacterized protein n=1 Tax=Anguilla anguilla TaxID=7936 RepID=A0A0E9SZ59_ANGAN